LDEDIDWSALQIPEISEQNINQFIDAILEKPICETKNKQDTSIIKNIEKFRCFKCKTPFHFFDCFGKDQEIVQHIKKQLTHRSKAKFSCKLAKQECKLIRIVDKTSDSLSDE
jgi:hypothetical protein